MRNHVIIGSTDLDSTCGMVLTATEYEPAPVKTEYLSVPGRTGDLDYTEALTGSVHYGNAKLHLTFTVNMNTWYTTAARTTVLALHGTKQTVAFTGGLYAATAFVGRLTVEPLEAGQVAGTVNLVLNIESEVPNIVWEESDP